MSKVKGQGHLGPKARVAVKLLTYNIHTPLPTPPSVGGGWKGARARKVWLTCQFHIVSLISVMICLG